MRLKSRFQVSIVWLFFGASFMAPILFLPKQFVLARGLALILMISTLFLGFWISGIWVKRGWCTD